MFVSVNEGLLPEAQNEYSAGYDVFANNDVIIYPGEMRTVKLGFKLELELEEKDMEMLENYFFAIYLRESLGKKGVMLVNGTGIINIDSNNEITLQLSNTIKDPKGYQNKNIEINKGERIAQIILQKNYGKLILGDKYRKVKKKEEKED